VCAESVASISIFCLLQGDAHERSQSNAVGDCKEQLQPQRTCSNYEENRGKRLFEALPKLSEFFIKT
jgi:hypothetical protein